MKSAIPVLPTCTRMRDNTPKAKNVKSIMVNKNDVKTLSADTPLREIQQLLIDDDGVAGFPVLREDGKVVHVCVCSCVVVRGVVGWCTSASACVLCVACTLKGE